MTKSHHEEHDEKKHKHKIHPETSIEGESEHHSHRGHGQHGHHTLSSPQEPGPSSHPPQVLTNLVPHPQQLLIPQHEQNQTLAPPQTRHIQTHLGASPSPLSISSPVSFNSTLHHHHNTNIAPNPPVVHNIVDVFIELNKIPKMKQFLENDENIELMEDFVEHLDLAWYVSQNWELAKQIMTEPEVFTKLIKEKHRHLRHPKHAPRYSGTFSILSDTSSLTPSLLGRKARKTMGFVQLRTIASIYLRSKTETSAVSITIPETIDYPFDASFSKNTPKCLQSLDSYLFLQRCVESNSSSSTGARNYFKIMNYTGTIILYGFEDDESCCNKFCMTLSEPVFHAKALVLMKKQSSVLSRRKISVFCPVDHYIGKIKQKWRSKELSTIVLIDKAGTTLLQIEVSQNPYNIERRSTFTIRHISDNQIIGTIVGESMSHFPEDYQIDPTLPDYAFEIRFPQTLNSNLKILLVTAWILIYKLYFDKKVRKATKESKARKTRETASKKKQESTLEIVSISPTIQIHKA